MKTVRVQKLVTLALVCGLALTCMNLFAQQATSPVRVPVGRPVPSWSQPRSIPTGPLPEPQLPIFDPLISVLVGQSFEGVDFNGSNCGCLPPDTNAAVGGNYVVETVNFEFRVFDKSTGTVLLDEPLSSLFGAFSGGDPYVVYDDIVGRWYVTAFDSNDAGLFIGVSKDGNPLDGFKTYDLTNVGGFPDYQKIGYNADAIVISYNDFGGGGGNAAILAIDKAAILSGILITYNSVPAPQFRAMPPAQMHGSRPGDPMWFVSTDGSDAGGNTMRVTKMTNVLSNAPVFTYTRLAVRQYQQAAAADQPGGPGSVTVFPNTTTTQVQYRKGHLLTAMASAQAKDGFVYPKGLYYKINVATGTPTLLKQGVIDPGKGVAVQMVSVDEDKKHHLGLTWMESSINEYLSMWVGTSNKVAKVDVAPGGGFFFDSFRLGDYSTTVVDPSDGLTFWSANEYIGSDGSTDVWRTHIASFTVK
jgi:hypothetical protein